MGLEDAVSMRLLLHAIFGVLLIYLLHICLTCVCVVLDPCVF